MATADAETESYEDWNDGRLPLEPLDPQLQDIQPGGGVIINLELAWGTFRRWYLKTFRSGYVARMRELRRGDANRCPHEVLDPRDLKFYQNQGGYSWDAKDDPFTWRDRLPFARAGLAELIVFSVLTFGLAAVLATIAIQVPMSAGAVAANWFCVVALTVVGGLIGWFFRNPRRDIPSGANLVVSPADGKIVTIEQLTFDEHIQGPAVLIGVFLSIFNVHINRAPMPSRVIALRYRRGKYLNALRPESARENEQLAVRIEGTDVPHRRMVVRQITGAIARRIVCWIKPGDELSAGQQFGMIKLGSRTELVLPQEEGLQIQVHVGDCVKAGSSVIADYNGSTRDTAS